jgi:hypothetical protein
MITPNFHYGLLICDCFFFSFLFFSPIWSCTHSTFSSILDEWSSINYQSKKKEKKKKKKFAIYGNLCFNVYIDLIINGFPQYNDFQYYQKVTGSILNKGSKTRLGSISCKRRTKLAPYL